MRGYDCLHHRAKLCSCEERKQRYGADGDNFQVMTENVEACKEGKWLNLARISAAFIFFLFSSLI
jgi:hypothetical protein